MSDDPSKQAGEAGESAAASTPHYPERRRFPRYPFITSVEVLELSSEARLSARISELGLGGCYVDTLNPFPEGTLVRLRLVRDKGVFETAGKVIYNHAGMGMGVAFTDMTPQQRAVIESWLAEAGS